MGNPKWMVYNGHIKKDDLGVPLFQETPIWFKKLLLNRTWVHEDGIEAKRECAPGLQEESQKTHKQCSKPLLVDDYGGLYYPRYWGN